MTDGPFAQDEMTRLQLAGHGQHPGRLADAARRPGSELDGGRVDQRLRLRLTPEQTRQLADELGAVLARWLEDHPADRPAEGSELVSMLLDLVPIRRVADVTPPGTVRSDPAPGRPDRRAGCPSGSPLQ